jgi:Fe-S cluster assembly protein SufD
MVNEHITGQIEALFLERAGKLNGLAKTSWHAFQKQALSRLLDVRFPDRRHEDWKYTPVNRLLGQDALRIATADPTLDLEGIDGLDTHVIHFRNGVADPSQWPAALTAAGIQVRYLHEAFDDPKWQEAFGRWLPGEQADAGRAFDLLNAAFHPSALYIDVPPNTILDKPVEVRIMHSDDHASMSNPLFFVRLGNGSEVTWLERLEGATHRNTHTDGFINAAGYFHLSPNARLTHIRWQNLPERQRLAYKLAVTQERDSRLMSQLFDRGGLVVRNTIDVELEAPGTFTSLEGAYLAAGQQSVTHQTRINHKVPHGESHEWYKGIIDGFGSAAFNGKVFVSPDAQKTNAFQQNDALVLSANALMNSKPQLEIFADDVRCSHGATIGQLDAQAMFYLRSRGLDEATARQMLKSAFLAPLVEHIPDSHLRAYIGPQMGTVL